jgi:phosphoribosylformylglycinamidine synthase
MADVRALVLTGFGINCEEEMAAAYRLAGAGADIVHINEVFLERYALSDYDILNFPGGFSFGDDLGSARVLSNKLKYKKLASGKLFFDELLKFVDDGGYMLGVCNGFQTLVKMGLLPNTGGNYEQEATLTTNDSGKFEDRWCRLFITDSSESPFLSGIDSIELPVRHGEGKLVFRDAEVRERVVANSQNCLSYCDQSGERAECYPENPNGSELSCAGLQDGSGHILGMMPHPEAYLSFYNHPDWGRRKLREQDVIEDGAGFGLFTNIVHHVSASG